MKKYLLRSACALAILFPAGTNLFAASTTAMDMSLGHRLETTAVQHIPAESARANATMEQTELFLGAGEPAISVAHSGSNQIMVRLSLPKGAQSAEVQLLSSSGQVYSVQHVDPNLQTPLIIHTSGFPKSQYTVRLMADGRPVAATRLVVR